MDSPPISPPGSHSPPPLKQTISRKPPLAIPSTMTPKQKKEIKMFGVRGITERKGGRKRKSRNHRYRTLRKNRS